MSAMGFSHDGEISGGGVFLGVRAVMRDRILPALRHNLRHSIPGHPAPLDADPARTASNEVLHGARSVEEAIRSKDEHQALHCVAPPTRKDAWHLVEVVFSAPPGLIGYADYLRDCVALLAAEVRAPIISAVIHRDQGAPHVHCLLLPLRDREWVGSRLLDRAGVRRLRAALFGGPAARYGLRQPPRLTGERRRDGALLVLAQMEQSPARDCRFWPEFRACIEANPAPFLARMGIAVAPERRGRSFTAIMTGTGKRTNEDACRRF